MKRIFKIATYIFISFLLSSCFWNSNDGIDEAKKEMGITGEETNENPVEEIEVEGNGVGNSSSIKETNKDSFNIENLTENVFLEIDDLSGIDFSGLTLEITGKTLVNVDKINVEFSNDDSDYPYDNYTLQKFQSGDDTFLYRAFADYETLDFGTNEYIFTAYSGDEISKTKLTITVNNEDNKSENITVEELDLSLFPIGENFGEPRQIGDGKITYSDIKGLSIEMLTENTYDCGINEKTGEYYVSEILDQRLDSYYWWNTCRPFGDNKGISFFVLRIEDTSYIYEKHIYLNNGIYGIYKIDGGDNFIEENEDYQDILTKLEEKNTTLKEENDSFSVVEIINDLFTKILNNLN